MDRSNGAAEEPAAKRQKLEEPTANGQKEEQDEDEEDVYGERQLATVNAAPSDLYLDTVGYLARSSTMTRRPKIYNS